jgi:hypothetical protein
MGNRQMAMSFSILWGQNVRIERTALQSKPETIELPYPADGIGFVGGFSHSGASS